MGTPLFGILLAGYLAGRLRVLPEGAGAVLSRFVFAVSLPALVSRTTAMLC